MENNKKFINNAIQIENLVTYLSNKYVHNNLNLTLKQNEILVILGKSGEGKSVLLKVIMKFLDHISGSIFINGNDIFNMSKRDFVELRRNIGILFQSKNTFDYLSIYDNIAFGLKYSKIKFSDKQIQEIVYQKMEQVGLDPKIAKLDPFSFSDGIQKKICLARILAIKPKIMLYDEPTTGFDPITANIINNLIKKLQREENISSIVVTHDLNSAFKIADRISVLHDGEICFTGTKKDLYYCKNPFIITFIKDFVDYPTIEIQF